MKVEELVFHAAGLPGRGPVDRANETGVLSICWADRWHRDSNAQLAELVRELMANGDLIFSPLEGRASSWEEMVHRSVGVPDPARRHFLITPIGLMEDMQVAVADLHGEPLVDELANYRLAADSDRIVTSAMANIRVLEQGLSDFARRVMDGCPAGVGRLYMNGVGGKVEIGEALTSVYLSRDFGLQQNQIRADVVEAYLRAMEDLQDAPFPYAQQFLNGWENFEGPPEVR